MIYRFSSDYPIAKRMALLHSDCLKRLIRLTGLTPSPGLTPSLIEAFCPAGGIVLDPFCGSGSTLAAARELGRSFIGIEIDGEHHDTASRRLFCQRAL